MLCACVSLYSGHYTTHSHDLLLCQHILLIRSLILSKTLILLNYGHIVIMHSLVIVKSKRVNELVKHEKTQEIPQFCIEK